MVLDTMLLLLLSHTRLRLLELAKIPVPSVSVFVLLLIVGSAIFAMSSQQPLWKRAVICSLTIIGGLLSYYDGIGIQDTLSNEMKYAGVARLGLNGYDMWLGSYMNTTDPLYNELLGTYEQKDDGVVFHCGPRAEAVYSDVAQKFPDYPFSYYELAFCKRKEGTADWAAYAEKAVSILKWTTQIGGHAPEHDEALQQLNDYLNTSK